MFVTRRSVRLPFIAPFKHSVALQRRKLTDGERKTATPVARQLRATGLWNYGRWAEKGVKRPKGDRARVNIVDESLCDDVLEYMGTSLERHVGCDLIDIYPGAGLWSTKLHEKLNPRSHILLEPDENIYKPFLKDLLGKPNTRLVPKSGIIWNNLSEILHPSHLPDQVERAADSSDAPKRNDTLLVTANLAFHPKKRFNNFDSVALLVLFQFISSIRASSLMQKYGLVRMLLWVGDDDKKSLLARSCQQRRRLAVEGELSTHWITEVAGADQNSLKRSYGRDHAIDIDSARQVLARMDAAGIQIPEGRQSHLVKEVLAARESEAEGVPQPTYIARPYLEELEHLQRALADGKIQPKTKDYIRLRQLKYRKTREKKLSDETMRLIREGNAVANAYGTGANTDEVQRRKKQWDGEILALNKSHRAEFLLMRDNMHLFYQTPSVMSWDRRGTEPLVVQDAEFFPNAACSLIDIQPKAMHPLMRLMGRHSNRAGDTFELLLRGMMQSSADPVSKSIETVWPGAAEGVLPHCPSLRDPAKGGTPLGEYGEISTRTLNETQWTEILEAWMKWPFRPTFPQLVSRMADESTMDMVDDDGDNIFDAM